LKNRGIKNNETSGGMWKPMETETGKVRVAETEGRRRKGRSWEEREEREREEKKNQKMKNESKKSSRRMGNLGQRRRSGEVGGIPTRKLCDHAIDIKEGFLLRKGKVYSLSREEREEVHEFISKQLRKRYIRPLKLPQTTLVFFVRNKNGKKRMVQNYRYLNEWTVKNNYHLPLILNIVENIGTKKVFTKMDLRWGYNNIRIKKGDE